MSNLVSGRQIRAARMLAGLTQAELARETGCHPRSVRYWESKDTDAPTNVASTLASIEQALNRESSRVMLKLPKRLLQVERLCSLGGLGKMII
jgi:transcriptional regulator with XRE-family HTH domain